MAVEGEDRDKGWTMKPLLKARNIGEEAMVEGGWSRPPDEPKGVTNGGQISGIYMQTN